MSETALVVAEKLDVAVLFTGDGMDRILKEIETKAMAHVPDISTDTGRDDIKSLAHKVARSKTLIDDLGKDTVSEWKKKAKAIDEHRKTARDFLDNLKVKVRQPLTDWEAIEAEKKAEEDARQKVIIDNRVLSLSQGNCNLPWMEVATMTDEEYTAKLNSVEATCLAEIEKQKAEEAGRKAESDRLEKVRVEQEAEAKRLAEVQRKIDEQERKSREEIAEAGAKIEAEKKALEDEKRRDQECKDREAFELRVKADAAIAAEKDRQEREAWEAKEKAEKHKRKLALRPDCDKLNDYANSLLSLVEPEVDSAEAKAVMSWAVKELNDLAGCIKIKASDL